MSKSEVCQGKGSSWEGRIKCGGCKCYGLVVDDGSDGEMFDDIVSGEQVISGERRI